MPNRLLQTQSDPVRMSSFPLLLFFFFTFKFFPANKILFDSSKLFFLSARAVVGHGSMDRMTSTVFLLLCEKKISRREHDCIANRLTPALCVRRDEWKWLGKLGLGHRKSYKRRSFFGEHVNLEQSLAGDWGRNPSTHGSMNERTGKAKLRPP